MSEAKTEYEVFIGLVVHTPDGRRLDLACPSITLPAKWLEDWHKFPTVPPDAIPETILAAVTAEMLTERYRNDEKVAGDVLQWAATYPFVCAHSETIKNLSGRPI